MIPAILFARSVHEGRYSVRSWIALGEKDVADRGAEVRKLTPHGFRRAVAYVKTRARPLERALYRYHFEEGSEDAAIDELLRFRNTDGGFGHALEPDVRTPSSSALATGIALRLITELDCPEGDELVPDAISYLLDTLDRKSLTWCVVPPDTNHSPHAPWWHDEEDSLAKTFDDFLIIPRVLILGSLHAYAALMSRELLEQMINATIEAISELPVLGTGGGSDLEYVAYLAAAPGLPHATRDLLTQQVAAAVSQRVITDPDKWSGYCLTPLRATPRPTSLGARAIREALDTHLDWTINHQAANGAWDPTWSWFGNYPEVWPKAQASMARNPHARNVAQPPRVRSSLAISSEQLGAFRLQ